jgi:hypothetical protein
MGGQGSLIDFQGHATTQYNSETTNSSLWSPGRTNGSAFRSHVSLDEMRAVWDTNVFGVLAVCQAMLPLRKSVAGSDSERPIPFK